MEKNSIKLELSCCLCSEDHKAEVEVPEGWQVMHGSVDAESGFCPEHAAILGFVDSQCPGCVGGWQDCPLWKAFAYSGQRDLGDKDFATLDAGVCPRRVNGTMGFGPGGMERIDLSEKAPNEAGQALSKAIRDYWERYPETQ